MKKNVWIWNHYATNMFKEQAGRHYWFAENLQENEYNPTIFCASTVHNSEENHETGDLKFHLKFSNEIPFVFVKTPSYKGNGKSRILNMLTFYKNLFSVAKEYADLHGKPDVILASSVHPLTLVAGIKIAKKLGVPCICEVRDLWPESLVAYGALKKNNLLTKILYQGEKWIYKKADSIIMTWEGGKDYIVNRGWGKDIELEKVKHISNGIVIEKFDENSIGNPIYDSDLDDIRYKNIVYTGSIRKVNNLGMILDTAKIIQKKEISDIRFLIYGSGDETELLKKRCIDEEINNVIFKGRVEKKYIPSILTKSYINILHNSSTSLDKYGQSQNKLFEYLAAGKCILQTYTTGFSVCETYNCGVSVKVQTSEEISKVLIRLCENKEQVSKMGVNAREASYNFDFKILTKKLIEIIKQLSNENKNILYSNSKVNQK